MTHLAYADFTDSHWYSGSPTDGGGIWIRDPVINGVTKLTDALQLLDQARKEVQAIENVLGTDIAGAETDLVTRLDRRISSSGHRRGAVESLRGANAVAGTYNNVQNWWDDAGSVYIQAGVDGPYSGASSVTITYAQSYFTSLEPDVIVCKLVGSTNQHVGAAQLRKDTVGITNFQAACRGWRNDGSWGVIDWSFYVMYVALGGFPAA